MASEKHDKDIIFIPIKLDACAVNEEATKKGAFRRWSYTYEALNYFSSPKPEALDRESIIADKGKQRTGIHLHWVLPRKLRSMEADAQEFPLVPNRWLLMRMVEGQQDKSKVWILESDCPESKLTDKLTRLRQRKDRSDYVVSPQMQQMWAASRDAYRANAVIRDEGEAGRVPTVSLGTVFPFEQWEERAAKEMFLTAYAPGNPAFAAYTPHNGNICSFFDELEQVEEASVSYFIAGWYSDAERDVAAACFSEERTPGSSLCCGAVFEIHWNREKGDFDGEVYRELRDNQKLNVAVGNQGMDICSEMMAYGCLGMVQDIQQQEAMKALQYGCLSDMQKPDGRIRLENNIHQSTFAGSTGGSYWEYADESKNETEAAAVTETEKRQLEELNQCQYTYDRELEKLKSMQWEVHALWWKNGHREFVKVSDRVKAIDYERELDPRAANSLMAQLLSQMEETKKCDTKLTQARSSVHLRDGTTLRQLPAERYYKSKNPVIGITGVEAARDLDSDTECNVQIYKDGTAYPTLFTDHRNCLPQGAEYIVNEFLWLTKERKGVNKPENARYSLDAWKPSWEPIFAEWELQYQHIPFTGKNWYFDGQDYRLKKDAATTVSLAAYKGVSLLSNHLPKLLKERVTETLKGMEGYERLEQQLKQIEGTAMLAQELEHLDDFMAQRDSRSFRRPTVEQIIGKDGKPFFLGDVLGYEPLEPERVFAPPEIQGHMDAVPYLLNETMSDFYGMRCGQAYFSELRIYDKFGRCLDVIDSGRLVGTAQAKNFPMLISEELLPERKLIQGIYSVFQLPPRVLQNIRLSAKECELGGYIIINHLNVSIMLYRPDGQQAGELALRAAESGVRKVTYIPPVHRSNYGKAQIKKEHPLLYAFAEKMLSKNDREFYAFLKETDSTLWTIDPFGDRNDENLSVLMGRVIALVEYELNLMTEGMPWKDNNWVGKDVGDSEFMKADYAMRVGDIELRNDGVIGYYAEKSMEQFHGIRENTQMALHMNAPRTLILFMDPRKSVHLYTGLLPVKVLKLQQEKVQRALEGMEASFFTGPVLTSAEENPCRIAYPQMAEQSGTWTWWKREPECEEGWREYSLAPVERMAGFAPLPPGLWEGTMQLCIDMNEKGEESSDE